jgi:hypothetical protein
MSTVFISYRRETSSGEARALFNELAGRLGKSSVFMDVDSIALGRDFRTALQKTLESCDLMLVVIDKHWLEAKDVEGRIRLQNPKDYVRMEIEAALKRDIVVTPVLVQGASMPSAEQLPAEMGEFAYRNAFGLSFDRWDSDVAEMVRRLSLVPSERKEPAAPDHALVPDGPRQIVPSKSPIADFHGLTRRRIMMTAAAVTPMAAAFLSYVWLKLKGQEPHEPGPAKLPGNEEPKTDVATKVEPIADIAARDGPIAAISAIASRSEIAKYEWKNRGLAPAGYIKGMALVYARVYVKLKNGNAAALDMAAADTGNAASDALTYYADTFAAAGMTNSLFGVATLRHLFVLLIGLGMRESGGNFCAGRDRSAGPVTAQSADAGIFQTTYSSIVASPLLTQVFEHYSTRPLGFENVFSEGARCTAGGAETVRSSDPDAEKFQQLSKGCPAFAAEFAAVGLRHIRSHWGPIVRREAEVRPECDAMLRQVQDFMDARPNVHAALE